MTPMKMAVKREAAELATQINNFPFQLNLKAHHVVT
jgi:hypothetical protein